MRWLSLSFLSSKDLYENIGRSGSFHHSSKRNRKFNDKHLVQTKPKGENTISINVMKTIHIYIAGSSLEVSEKKVDESWYKKNNSQQAEKRNIVCSDITKAATAATEV